MTNQGTASGTVQIMHIVAHPDDDLFFMNPDIALAIASGLPTVTVFITASEISGNGTTPEEKARSLQRGVMDAYARMAGVADTDPDDQEEWVGQAWTIGSRQVEKYSLRARPEIQFVFMNLHDARLGDVYDNGLTDQTVVPTGGTVTRSFNYNKSNVTSVLSQIITAYKPSVLRCQDPLPDFRYYPEHVDHMAGVRFARDAAAKYTAGQLVQVHYRDYNITDVPANLTSQAASAKQTYFEYYARYDAFAIPLSWLDRMYYRWPIGTRWVGRNADGRPQAFIVRSGVVRTWWRTAAGGWGGPTALEGAGGQVVPGVSVINNSTGALQVFARRRDDHHLITIAQTSPGGSWPTRWTDLGNPNLGLGNEDQVGVPAVAANADGSLWMFVRDGGGGVSAKRQRTPNGSWGDWLDLLGGSDVQDGLAAIRGNDGKIEMFASTRENVRTWRQTAPNGDMVENGTLPTRAGLLPASPPSVTRNQDGTLEVLYREAGTGDLITTFQTGIGGSWYPQPVGLGGRGGVGEPALLTAPPGTDARIMVFTRDDAGGVSMTKQSAPDSPYGSWEDLGGTIVDYPAATTDAAGAAVVFAIGVDGRLYARRQATAGADVAFEPWEPVEQ